MLWGVLIGSLTFAAGTIGAESSHTVVAAIQYALTLFMIPGLIVAGLVGSLIPGAAINAVVNFGVCFLLLRVLPPFRKRSVRSKSSSPFDNYGL
jgi:hypothetical protein